MVNCLLGCCQKVRYWELSKWRFLGSNCLDHKNQFLLKHRHPMLIVQSHPLELPPMIPQITLLHISVLIAIWQAAHLKTLTFEFIQISTSIEGCSWCSQLRKPGSAELMVGGSRPLDYINRCQQHHDAPSPCAAPRPVYNCRNMHHFACWCRWPCCTTRVGCKNSQDNLWILHCIQEVHPLHS